VSPAAEDGPAVRRLRLAAAIALAALSLPAARAAAGPVAPSLAGIRPLGMGNAFVAVADDRNALSYNPAGLAHVTREQMSGIGVNAGVDSRFFEVIDFVRANRDAFSDFDNVDREFYDSLAPFDDRWVVADARAAANLVRPYFGLGVYTAGSARFKIDRGIYEPRVYADVTDDIVTVVGGALELGHVDLRLGGALQGIWRRSTSRALTALEVADFDPNEIARDLETADPGFAVDLGLTWQRSGSAWRTGAVVRNAAGSIGKERFDTAVDVGAAWRPALPGAGPVRALLLAADLRNLFQDDALGNKIHVGAEVSFPIVAIRTGLQQGYPTVGASVALPFFTLDYAFYGRELGGFPGAESQFMHAFEARIGY